MPQRGPSAVSSNFNDARLTCSSNWNAPHWSCYRPRLTDLRRCYFQYSIIRETLSYRNSK